MSGAGRAVAAVGAQEGRCEIVVSAEAATFQASYSPDCAAHKGMVPTFMVKRGKGGISPIRGHFLREHCKLTKSSNVRFARHGRTTALPRQPHMLEVGSATCHGKSDLRKRATMMSYARKSDFGTQYDGAQALLGKVQNSSDFTR